MNPTLKKIGKKLFPLFLINLYRKIRSKKNQLKEIFNTKKSVRTIRKHYAKIEQRLRNRGSNPLRIAFYVMYASDFGESDVFAKMLTDKDFLPQIIVVPDVARGREHMLKTYKETKDFLIKEFGTEYIKDGYDEKSDTYFDYSNDFDIISSNCPYDGMLHPFHKISYLNTKNVLTVHTVYGYFVSKYGERELFPQPEISGLWKIFLDTDYTFKAYKKHSICKGKNAYKIGYSKMDNLAKCLEEKKSSGNSSRKKILISPHHTIKNSSLPLSNFLSYYNLILELPVLYPDIDFVFRPHPLLFTNLVNQGFWTSEEVIEYIKNLEQKDISYNHTGSYFDVFAECDAIIHDCASYVTEWLFTGKPCCFAAKDDHIFDFFSELGKECIKYYTVAYNREQIFQFIDCIRAGKNFKQYMNNPVLKQKIMLNYPNVSQKIVDFLRLR